MATSLAHLQYNTSILLSIGAAAILPAVPLPSETIFSSSGGAGWGTMASCAGWVAMGCSQAEDQMMSGSGCCEISSESSPSSSSNNLDTNFFADTS